MGQFTLVEKRGRITIITINRPEVMNALHPPTNFELEEAFNDFAADNEQWVAILTGAGDRAFSAGNDLKFHASIKDVSQMKVPDSGFGGLAFRYNLTKPVIAAVNGICYGGGFETALACDLIIASEKATFALPEGKVGLCAGAGGLHRLPRIVGLKHAMGICLTGRVVKAQEAFSLGFVNEVVTHTAVMPAALKWAEMILDNSPLSVRATKEVITTGLDIANLEDSIKSYNQVEGVHKLFTSNDCIEGPLAFSQKRKPKWTGT